MVFGVYTGPQEPEKPLALMSQEEQAEMGAKKMIEVMQSCPGKTVMAGGSGFFLGGFFGLFMASMAYDVPMGGSTVNHISELPFKQQMKLQFSDMAKRSYSSAKNFGYIGMIFSGVECSIESLRAKHDIYNGVTAGCITGAGLSIKAGPQAALLGCAGFAAFSTAIDLYMNSENAAPLETTLTFDDPLVVGIPKGLTGCKVGLLPPSVHVHIYYSVFSFRSYIYSLE